MKTFKELREIIIEESWDEIDEIYPATPGSPYDRFGNKIISGYSNQAVAYREKYHANVAADDRANALARAKRKKAKELAKKKKKAEKEKKKAEKEKAKAKKKAEKEKKKVLRKAGIK